MHKLDRFSNAKWCGLFHLSALAFVFAFAIRGHLEPGPTPKTDASVARGQRRLSALEAI
jgi:hypothetical protein